MSQFYEGQSVILTEHRHHRKDSVHTEVQIARVGRQYFYVDRHNITMKFSKTTGVEAGKDSNYLARIRTPEQFKKDDQRNAVIDRIRAKKWGRTDYRNWPESTETLEAIANLLEQDGVSGE